MFGPFEEYVALELSHARVARLKVKDVDEVCALILGLLIEVRSESWKKGGGSDGARVLNGLVRIGMFAQMAAEDLYG